MTGSSKLVMCGMLGLWLLGLADGRACRMAHVLTYVPRR